MLTIFPWIWEIQGQWRYSKYSPSSKKFDGRTFKSIRTHPGYILLHKLKTWISLKMKIFIKLHVQIKIRKSNDSFSRKDDFKNMFEKSQILRATPHQHINLKQSLKIDIHKFWMSNMHKICGSQNCLKTVIDNSSGYYNMFSCINLGF